MPRTVLLELVHKVASPVTEGFLESELSSSSSFPSLSPFLLSLSFNLVCPAGAVASSMAQYIGPKPSKTICVLAYKYEFMSLYFPLHESVD